jgi:hypothetical protein
MTSKASSHLRSYSLIGRVRINLMTGFTRNKLMITMLENQIRSFKTVEINMAGVALLSIDFPTFYNF